MPLAPLPKPSARPPGHGPHHDGDLEIVEPLCAVFRRALKAEGQKYTPERAHILDIVTRRDGLFEAELVREELRDAGIHVSKATVYRTLKLLQDSGVIRRVLSDGDQASYQLVYGRKPHDLIIRVDTRQVIAVEAPELIALRDRLCAQHGLIPVGHTLHIFASAPADPKPRRRA